MKKILMSSSLIIAVIGLVGTATYAIFTAQDNLPGNTISSATATLDVHNLSGNKPINTTNMLPGQWTPDGRAELYNTGTSAMKVYMYADNVVGAACDKTNLKVSTGHAGGDETANTLFNGSLSSITGAGNRIQTTVTPPFDILEPNITQVIHQQAQLDPSADNSYQGTTCTWDEVFVGETTVGS